MENWDQHLTKVESKSSNRESKDSNKGSTQRVGGGGMIAKPPRNPSERTSKQGDLTGDLNISGQGATERGKQQSNTSNKNGSQQSLPNLLDKNSRQVSNHT